MPVALVGGAAAIGGAAIGASASKKAADTAASAARYAADQNAALARENRDMLRGYIDPYVTGTQGAVTAISDRVGLTDAQDRAGYLAAYSDVGAEYQRLASTSEGQAYLAQQGVRSAEDFAGLHYRTNGAGEGRTMGELPSAQDQLAQQVGSRQTYTRPAQVGLPGLPTLDEEGFKKSGYYQLGLKTGMNNLNANFGARGLLKSGSAVEGATKFGQENFANNFSRWTQDELAKYDRQFTSAQAQNALNNTTFDLDRAYGTGVFETDRGYATGQYNTTTDNLFRTVGVGQAGVNALAGVGNNYVNNVTASNNQAASATGNAAIAGANSTNALIGDAATAIGNIAGAYANTGANLFARNTSPTPASASANYWGSGSGAGYTSPYANSSANIFKYVN